MLTTPNGVEVSDYKSTLAPEVDTEWREAKPDGGSIQEITAHAVRIDGSLRNPASTEEQHLVHRLFYLPRTETPRAVVFCGVGPQDGSEFVCARAAEVLASQATESVCLIDANLKDPSLHRRYEMDAGLKLLRQKAATGNDKPAEGHRRNLWVLPSAALKESCPDFTREQLKEKLSKLREKFGFLLISAPPLEASSDGILLGQLCDGMVMVMQPHSTRRTSIVKIRQNLETYDVRLLGVVLNERSSNSVNEWFRGYVRPA